MIKGIETHGEIKEISVLEPLPGEVGLTSVVSMSVHPSPLKPQLPVCRYAMAPVRGPLLVKSPPVERTRPPWMSVGFAYGSNQSDVYKSGN